jgi:hypothetical protein
MTNVEKEPGGSDPNYIPYATLQFPFFCAGSSESSIRSLPDSNKYDMVISRRPAQLSTENVIGSDLTMGVGAPDPSPSAPRSCNLFLQIRYGLMPLADPRGFVLLNDVVLGTGSSTSCPYRALELRRLPT